MITWNQQNQSGLLGIPERIMNSKGFGFRLSSPPPPGLPSLLRLGLIAAIAGVVLLLNLYETNIVGTVSVGALKNVFQIITDV